MGSHFGLAKGPIRVPRPGLLSKRPHVCETQFCRVLFEVSLLYSNWPVPGPLYKDALVFIATISYSLEHLRLSILPKAALQPKTQAVEVYKAVPLGLKQNTAYLQPAGGKTQAICAVEQRGTRQPAPICSQHLHGQYKGGLQPYSQSHTFIQ